MKYINSLLAMCFLLIVVSCHKDDPLEHEHEENEDTVYEYHAHIHSPTEVTRVLGDTISIKVNFESHTGEPVHHVNVLMHKADDASSIVFSEPEEAHIHNLEGNFTYEKLLILNENNGVTPHTDYTLKASVWGAKDGEELIEEEVTFHVHMN